MTLASVIACTTIVIGVSYIYFTACRSNNIVGTPKKYEDYIVPIEDKKHETIEESNKQVKFRENNTETMEEYNEQHPLEFAIDNDFHSSYVNVPSSGIFLY